MVIPKGSTAIATVTEAVPKRRMARGGKLAMIIDYVRLPNGDKLALRGVQDVKGGGHTGLMTGGMVAAAIVFFPAAPFFLFMHGKDISIPKGHEVTVYTNSDYTVPVPQTRGEAGGTKSGTALTNADVIKLKEAGLSEQVIVDKIRSAPSAFSLETDDLLALKTAGISDAIISAMLQAQSPSGK